MIAAMLTITLLTRMKNSCKRGYKIFDHIGIARYRPYHLSNSQRCSQANLVPLSASVLSVPVRFKRSAISPLQVSIAMPR